MPSITRDQLLAKEACGEQVSLFSQHFGESVEITEELCLSVASLFDWDWAARNFLKAPALKAYDEATAPAWKAYDEARATALKAYEEATAPAWKAYDEAKAPAWKAYEEATAPALKAYDEARATAFARLYITQETPVAI